MVTIKDITLFEGVEKTLEIWFMVTGDIQSGKDFPNLRNLPCDKIKTIVNSAKCEIVNQSQNENQTAFILSESSLFISKNRLILKTCGKTTLLDSLKHILAFGYELGFSNYVVYYSRRSFLYPELQPLLYQKFEKEIKHIQWFCKDSSGFTFGKDKNNCWYFYRGQAKPGNVEEPQSQTIEIIMRDLNPEKMTLFYSQPSNSADNATKTSGIQDLFSDSKLDAFLFDPCGYSVNGLMNKDEYFTIHVTPQSQFSYASFEANVAMACYSTLISSVVQIFEPKRFICILFAEQNSSTICIDKSMNLPSSLLNYEKCDQTLIELAYYRKLLFTEFVKTS